MTACVLSTTITPKARPDLWVSPAIRTQLAAAWPLVKAAWPNVTGYVGTDGERLYFQAVGNPTRYSVALS